MPSAYSNPTLVECNDPEILVCYESGRLASFDRSDWPYPEQSLCSKKQMAKAGFYFQSKPDCVRCFVCHRKFSGWNPEKDNPWVLHQQLAGASCIFAQMGKEELKLTFEQWLDVQRDRAINRIDYTVSKYNME